MSGNELVGRPIGLLMPERFRESHMEHQEIYFADPRRRPMGMELSIFGQTKEGREIPLEISLSPMEMPEGHNGNLQRCATSPSAKQAEQALRLAKEAAVSADRLKSRFVAAASHDLRQPLQTIGLLGGRAGADGEGRGEPKRSGTAARTWLRLDAAPS